MGKPYNLQFHLAPYGGSVGTMICAKCAKPIDAKKHDFRSAMRSDCKDGWRYVVHHRECLREQGGFQTEEKNRAARVGRNRRLLSACLAFREEWGIDDLDELIGDLS